MSKPVNSKVVPVVLSGGSGSRLWPKSRHHFPKQLHRLYGSKTMLQETIERVKHLEGRPIVICSDDQRFMVAEQVKELGLEANIILEPLAKNTAPAIVVAALKAQQDDPDAIVAVFPADHIIKDVPAFSESLEIAVYYAGLGKLVTFGVVPSKPETGYGYIKAKSAEGGKGFTVESFVEKPNLELVQEYLSSGDYYWNSGMFVFSAKALIEEVTQYHPEMIVYCQQAMGAGTEDLDFFRLDKDSFAQCDSESIDCAVMERTNKAYMVPLDAGWSDVGSWEALWEVGEKDQNENVFFGDVIAEKTKNSYVNSEGRLVALVGVEDLVVVETADSVLVAKKDSSQQVKKIVEVLKKYKRKEYLSHREVFRPWGSYDLVDTGDRFYVKRIVVKPSASLSLQMHHHRAEHWVVVCGTALVQKGEVQTILTENQSIYIPLGEKHRLTNPGMVALHLVEVASGSYLEEDDVVRFD